MFVVENLPTNFICKVKITSSMFLWEGGMSYIEGHYTVSTVFSLSFLSETAMPLSIDLGKDCKCIQLISFHISLNPFKEMHTVVSIS